MAYIDSQLQVSAAQALTATAVSTNVIDLGTARRIFEGEPLIVAITVDVAADAADADETYQFDLETDDNVGFSSATVLATRTIPRAELTVGSVHTLAVPVEANAEQFLRLNYTLGGTTPSITVSADLRPQSMVDKRRDYPDGFVITG